MKGDCVRDPIQDCADISSNLLTSLHFCKVAYKIFIKEIASRPHKTQSKWLSDCRTYGVDKIDWCKSYNLAFLCTRETKLRTFQFKFLHRRIATNSYLFKIGISQSDRCCFCKGSSETLLHLFWECPYVQSFWNEVKTWIYSFSCFSNVNFSFLSCLGLAEDTSNLLFHHILLSARHYIYRSKLMNSSLSREPFTRGIQTCFNVEKRYAIQNGTLSKFRMKWGTFISDSFSGGWWGEQQT